MRYQIPAVRFDAADCMVEISNSRDSVWLGAEDIQAVITALLAAYSEYVDEQNRRENNGG